MSINTDPQPLYLDINPNGEVTSIDSLCMECYAQGKTNLMMTTIPFFKEIIISSFACDSCGFKNSEIQSGGKIEPRGVRYSLTLDNIQEFNRELIKSEYATISIAELGFEIPSTTQKGSFNTIEGVLLKTADSLDADQPFRHQQNPEAATKIDEFIASLRRVLKGEVFPLTFVMDDPSGNSFIQNPNAPNPDLKMKIENYVRDVTQLKAMGFNLSEEDIDQVNKEQQMENAKAQALKNTDSKKVAQEQIDLAKQMEEMAISAKNITAQGVDFNQPLDENQDDLKQEAMQFDTPCPNCMAPGKNIMCLTSVPHFKELIIMNFNCEVCGMRETEVKTGGAISAKGKKIAFRIEKPEDLNRDMFKPETAVVYIPELGFEYAPGNANRGHLTTIEGLIDTMMTSLRKSNPFEIGDSHEGDGFAAKFKAFMARMEHLKTGTETFTLVLDDPMDNCWIYNPYEPIADPQMTITEYERSWEQNEELGINDMNTENYQNDA
eukprot:CAMPEP_0114982670 /NCGR_PEP_ID=MMETSP0216-20121206/6256_1 /TAXON_ID=223996 /ORGANISM="Protocruzia adherens, Strain Boccale" /LENGTH=492 /DNA_ID=CAMNT_0002344533 /DNA_START=96 /DNA_END=1574 /DNA_ORIENTATION=+